MSEGPIKAWWESHRPAKVSTTDSERVCLATEKRDRGYCGRTAKGDKVTTEPSDVVCADCIAAWRADHQAKRGAA